MTPEQSALLSKAHDSVRAAKLLFDAGLPVVPRRSSLGLDAWRILCSLCQRLPHRFGIVVNDFQQCTGSLVGDKTPLLPIAHHRQR